MHLRPAAPEEAHDDMQIDSVDVRQQVEGELLNLSESEKREKLREGEQRLFEVLQTVGIDVKNMSAETIAGCVAADPNMLSKLPMGHLSEDDHHMMATYLLTCLGKATVSVRDRNRSTYSTHFQCDTPLLSDISLSRRLRNSILSTVEPENEEAKGSSKLARDYALKAAFSDVSAPAPVALQGTLSSDDKNSLASASRDVENRMAKTKLMAVQHRFPVDIWDFPLRMTGRSQKFHGESASEVLAAMEEERNAAVAYKAHAARKRRTRSNVIDALEDSTEEEPVDEARYAREPIESLYPSSLRGVTRQERKQPFSDVQIAAGLCLYVDKYPDAAREDLALILASIVATAETVPREAIPDEIISFLAKNLWSHPLESGSLMEGHLQTLLALPPERRNEDGIRSCFMGESALMTWWKTVDKARGSLHGTPIHILAKNLLGDPRLVEIVSAWLDAHGNPITYSQQDYDKELREFGAFVDQQLQERFDIEPQDYFHEDSQYDEDNAYKTYARFNHPSLHSVLLPRVLWMVRGDLLPLKDAFRKLTDINIEAEKSGRSEGVPAEITEPVLHRIRGKTPEDAKALWTRCAKWGSWSCLYLLKNYASLLSPILRSDPAWFTTAVEHDVIRPLLEKAREQQDVYSGKYILEALDAIARVDPDEAQGMLRQIAHDPIGANCLRLTLSKERRFSGGFDDYAALGHICHASLVYPRLTPKNSVQDWEKSGGRGVPLPVALAQQWEAKGGVPWFPRSVPTLDPDAFERTFLPIVTSFQFPDEPENTRAPRENDGHDEKKSSGESRSQTMQEQRDSLLNNLDADDDAKGAIDADSPELPSASMLSENPGVIGELSAPLTGDARYMRLKLCDDFDAAWLAHIPLDAQRNLDARPLLNRPVEGGEAVTLNMHMSYGAVVPLPASGAVESVDVEGGRARWASHWSRRIDTPKPTDVTIGYRIGEDIPAGQQTVNEVLDALPASLKERGLPLAGLQKLPETLATALRGIDVQNRPYADIVREVQSLVHRWYRYHFIVNHPKYKEKYRELLKGMPYADPSRNQYLDFIHSLREDDEENVLGRGVCGQLATVLVAALRSIGCPAFFAAGYFAAEKTITTNHGHAWADVPMLDDDGTVVMKPIEATSGGSDGLEQTLREAPRVAAARKQKDKTSEDAASVESDRRAGLERIDARTEEWRRHFQDVLELPQITAEDVLTARRIVLEAETLRRSGAVIDEQNAAQMRTALETSSAPTPKNFVDALHDEGLAASPGVRKNMDIIASALKDTLSPGTLAIVRYLQDRGSERYAAIVEEMNRSMGKSTEK